MHGRSFPVSISEVEPLLCVNVRDLFNYVTEKKEQCRQNFLSYNGNFVQCGCTDPHRPVRYSMIKDKTHQTNDSHQTLVTVVITQKRGGLYQSVDWQLAMTRGV